MRNRRSTKQTKGSDDVDEQIPPFAYSTGTDRAPTNETWAVNESCTTNNNEESVDSGVSPEERERLQSNREIITKLSEIVSDAPYTSMRKPSQKTIRDFHTFAKGLPEDTTAKQFLLHLQNTGIDSQYPTLNNPSTGEPGSKYSGKSAEAQTLWEGLKPLDWEKPAFNPSILQGFFTFESVKNGMTPSESEIKDAKYGVQHDHDLLMNWNDKFFTDLCGEGELDEEWMEKVEKIFTVSTETKIPGVPRGVTWTINERRGREAFCKAVFPK